MASEAQQSLSASESAPVPVRVPVCGIGASAGGVEALQQFFAALPVDLGLAYVVVVHLSPDHKSELPAILARWTQMPVVQVADHAKEKLAPNHVYVIAPDRKLEITDSSVGAAKFEQPRGRRAAIDLFFRSLAESRGDGFAVVLSGSGSDGAIGAKAIKEHGGLVLVQDPRNAAHGQMPSAVIATGVADVVLPPRELAQTLAALVHSKSKLPSVLRDANATAPIEADEAKALKGALDLLHRRTGHDFTKYKRATVLRRLSRRMQLAHKVSVADYLQYMQEQPDEVQALFDDLLISVTTFFRDPEAWAALQQKVIGPLIETTEPDEQLRAWVVGCATGEEAYTLAILFAEEFERRKTLRNVMIFASDIDEGALAYAREGIYPPAIEADVSQRRLARYFRAEDDQYRVVAEIRDRLVFAAHNVLRDPPFSRLHLLSCRNLLIYLDHDLQQRVMGIFRYASREHAHLFLGASETADDELFEPLDKKHRIYAARPRSDGINVLPELLAQPGARAARLAREAPPSLRASPSEIHIALLEEVAPPSVVIDDRWTIVHLSSSVARYFLQSGGVLARRITDQVRPELRDELHATLHRASDQSEPVLSQFVAVRFDGSLRRVAVLAQKRPPAPDGRMHILVTFLDAGDAGEDSAAIEAEPSSEVVRILQDKLRLSDRRLESMRDDNYATNEDLRAANEELQSLNEEYRSTTEELETSKEELQSINEELLTVNNELKLKLDEVSRANNDLENLMASTDVATLFLDRELRIKRFTPRLGEIFNIQKRDHERPIRDLTHTLDYDTLEVDAMRVMREGVKLERAARSRNGQAFIVHVLPYRSGHRSAGAGDGAIDGAVDGVIEGAVVTFIDVSAIERAQTALRVSEGKVESGLGELAALNQSLMRRTAELEASQERLARRTDELVIQDRNRDDFLAALGHELRNPLAAIHNSLSVMTVGDERSERALAIFQRQVKNLTRLVNDLLDSMRVKHGRLRLERQSIDLVACALSALETVRSQAQGKGLALEFEPPATPLVVDADPDRLAQVIDNVLRNAVSYTDKGKVTLELARADRFAHVIVRDTGIGIDPRDASELFKPYEQRDYGGRGKGLGLGLTLAKALVESHGGQIGFNSDGMGKGSEFWFSIPLAAGAAEITAENSDTVAQQRRVLVVDDNHDVAETMKTLLELFGQTVELAYDGETALRVSREFMPQVAILDLSMPGMSGTELARRLRTEFSPHDLTLVAFTGRSDAEDAARENGFQHFLIKPVSSGEVTRLLNSLSG